MPNGIYFILKTLIGLLQSAMSADVFKEWAHEATQLALRKIEESETQIDDDLLKPFMEMLDSIFE